MSKAQSVTEQLLIDHLPAIAEAWRTLQRRLRDFENKLLRDRTQTNEAEIKFVKIYPPELDGEKLIGLQPSMAPDEGMKLAARVFGNLEHQEHTEFQERRAPLSVKCYGTIGVPQSFIDRAIDINLAKKKLRDALQPLAGQQMRVQVKTKDGRITRRKRELRTVAMRRLQSSEINLLAAYRNIPVLPEQVRTIRFDQVRTQTTVARTAAELLHQLDAPGAGAAARADIERLLSIPKDEVLSRPSNSYPRMRARVTYARRVLNTKTNRFSHAKRVLPAELPILYPVSSVWPEPNIVLPSFKETDGPPRRLEDEPFVVTLGFCRRKPQYRGEKKRGRPTASHV